MTRFAKGTSGNPKGRPRNMRSKVASTPSAFDVVIDKVLTVTQQGRSRDLTVEEALQLKTYQAAIAGSRPARREILKMIAKREAWLASKKPITHSIIKFANRYDPDTANAALKILGITVDNQRGNLGDTYDRVKLASWAIEAALERSRSRRMSANDLSEAKHCALEPDAIRWPAPSND